MKTICARFGVVMLLSACGGTSGPAPVTNPPATLTNPANIIGNTYGDTLVPLVNQDGTTFGATTASAVSVLVVNAKQIDVTISGITTRLTATDKAFVSDDGNFVANYGQGTDQIVFFGDQYDPISGLEVAGMFVDGNRTTNMPTTGTAVYATGGVSTIDGTWAGGGSLSNGSIALVADFANGSIGGTMDGLLSAAPGTVFDLTPTAIVGNGFSTTLTTLDPSVVIAGSAVNGSFFGSGAASVGGTVRLDTNLGNAVGVFTSEP